MHDLLLKNEVTKLYHLSFSKVKNNLFVPRVPEIRLEGEDCNVLRICFSETIEGCISAMPNGVGSIKGLVILNEEDISCCGVYLYELDLSKIKKDNIITPKELMEKGLVPDALQTGEYWIINQKVKCKNPKLIKISDITTLITDFGDKQLELVKRIDYSFFNDKGFEKESLDTIIYTKKYFYNLLTWSKKSENKVIFEKENGVYYCRIYLKNGKQKELYQILTEDYWAFIYKGMNKIADNKVKRKKPLSRNSIMYVTHESMLKRKYSLNK